MSSKDDDVIKDGEKVVVPMQFMDSAWHQPGFRRLAPAARTSLADRRRQAYQDYEDWLVVQYKDEYANPACRARSDGPATGYGSGELCGAKVGDPCTRNGWPGVLVHGQNGELVCRIKRLASGRDAVCDDCEGTGECPTCSGTGVARGTGWLTEPDEDIESFVEAATRGATTHHESNVRRDVPDTKTVDELRVKHSANMQKIYADSDRELSEQWRKK